MSDWNEDTSGSFDDDGPVDLSFGGESDNDYSPDWQEFYGQEDEADLGISDGGNGYDEMEFNDPDSHLVGADTDEAILNARLRSVGIPITSSNTMGQLPEYMRPSAVTKYDLSGLPAKDRNIEGLTRGMVAKGVTTIIDTPHTTEAQRNQFYSILTSSKKEGAEFTDALPAIRGHANALEPEDFEVGGMSVSRVLFNIAGNYLEEGVDKETQRSLGKRLGIMIPRISKGLQASFGSDQIVSHMDAMPTPMQLPARYTKWLKPTLNTLGLPYDKSYRDTDSYRKANKAAKAKMDWDYRASPMASLTGARYESMGNSEEQNRKLTPERFDVLQDQRDIESDFKGFLSLAGLAKDSAGRKLSADNSQGTATHFINANTPKEYHGSSNLDQLAAHGLLDDAGLVGTDGREGDMSALGNYANTIMDDYATSLGSRAVDFNKPFTAKDIASAMGEEVEEAPTASTPATAPVVTKPVVTKPVATAPVVTAPVVTAPAPTPRAVRASQPTPTFEDALVANKPVVEGASTETVEQAKESETAAQRANAQANVEARLKGQGLNISNAEQGSAQWLKDRSTVLTSTGIATSMAEPVYGDTWMGHLKAGLEDKANPEAAARRSNAMFDAGTAGEVAGKKWFENKFDKKIVDLGLITDPSKPNQGTSVDGVITSATGEIGDDLELAEFKWGTTRFPPRDAAKKHQQQLQHQMYMTGATSVDLITGYDPMSGGPQAGKPENFIFNNEPVFKDPEWAANNKDFIQARANEKAGVMSSGSTEDVKEGYLAALAIRYPNESDKGYTKEEKAARRAEDKQQAAEDRIEAREEKATLRQENKRTGDALRSTEKHLGIMSKGVGGYSASDGIGMLSNMGMAGKVIGAGIGVVAGAYSAARDVNDMVGEAADAGASNTQQYKGSIFALKRLGFNDQQADKFARDTYTQQAMAAMGEFDPLVKRLTAYRGMVSMDDLVQDTPEQITVKLRSKVSDGTITEKELAGMVAVAGDGAIARNFQDDKKQQEILAQAKLRADKGEYTEKSLRDTTSDINDKALDINVREGLIESGITWLGGVKGNYNARFNPQGELKAARDKFSDASTARGLNKFKFWASDEEDARVAREYKAADADLKLQYSKSLNGGAAYGDVTANRPIKLESTIKIELQNKQASTQVDQKIDGVPQPTKNEISREY